MNRSKVLWGLILLVLVGVYTAVDGVPRLTAYSHMTPAQKHFYQSLEAREFTIEQKNKSVDIFAEFSEAYDLKTLTDRELVKLLLKQGFWIQGGDGNADFFTLKGDDYGGFLRKQIYPGIKGRVLRGDVFVGMWRRSNGESGINAKVIFLTRFF